MKGDPDLTAPVPRMKGHADLTGVWQSEHTPVSEFTRVLGAELTELQIDLSDITKHVINVFWGAKPETGRSAPAGGCRDPEAARANPCRTRTCLGWDIRWASGKEIRWSWKPPVFKESSWLDILAARG
jgi:hypothetical protein